MELSDTVKQKALAGTVAVFILGMGSYWVFGTGDSELEEVQVATNNVERPQRTAVVTDPVTKPQRSRNRSVVVADDKPARPRRPIAVRDQTERGRRTSKVGPKREKVKPLQPMG